MKSLIHPVCTAHLTVHASVPSSLMFQLWPGPIFKGWEGTSIRISRSSPEFLPMWINLKQQTRSKQFFDDNCLGHPITSLHAKQKHITMDFFLKNSKQLASLHWSKMRGKCSKSGHFYWPSKFNFLYNDRWHNKNGCFSALISLVFESKLMSTRWQSSTYLLVTTHCNCFHPCVGNFCTIPFPVALRNYLYVSPVHWQTITEPITIIPNGTPNNV